jgi:mRNA interferase MazF
MIGVRQLVKKSGKYYIPERGDIIWLDFDRGRRSPASPSFLRRGTGDLQRGREQAGHRPAIVLSPQQFNSLSSLAFVCPITSKVKGFSFEVPLTEATQTQGVILIHHLRSIDWKTRKIKLIEKAPVTVIEEITAKLEPLIF